MTDITPTLSAAAPTWAERPTNCPACGTPVAAVFANVSHYACGAWAEQYDGPWRMGPNSRCANATAIALALRAELAAVTAERDRLKAEQSDPFYLYAGSRIHRAAIESRNSEISKYLGQLIHIQKIIGLENGAGENGERLVARLQGLVAERDRLAGLLEQALPVLRRVWAQYAPHGPDDRLGRDERALLQDVATLRDDIDAAVGEGETA